jgi:FolB domain-containing protein
MVFLNKVSEYFELSTYYLQVLGWLDDNTGLLRPLYHEHVIEKVKVLDDQVGRLPFTNAFCCSGLLHRSPLTESARKPFTMDTLYVRNIRLNVIVGRDCWHRDKSQPVAISVCLATSMTRAGETDDMVDAIDYSEVCKRISNLGGSRHPNLYSFSQAVCQQTITMHGAENVSATVLLPKALLSADGVGLEGVMASSHGETKDSPTFQPKGLFIKDLRLSCIIGVGDFERKEKQPIVVNIRFPRASIGGESDYQARFKPIFEVCAVHRSWLMQKP